MQIGYDPTFIGDGINIPLPKFSPSLSHSVLRKPDTLRQDIYSDHLHFTIVMNEHNRQLIYSAYNIDQTQFRDKVKGEGKRSWRNAKDIGADYQLDNKYVIPNSAFGMIFKNASSLLKLSIENRTVETEKNKTITIICKLFLYFIFFSFYEIILNFSLNIIMCS